MCTETFLRLPEEKRNRFLDAAWGEFTRVPFTDASINKIVLRAKIPRGSFYQYFEDKKDLFFYLVGSMMGYFLEEYSKMFDQMKGDIFKTQIWCFDRVLLEKYTHPLFKRGMQILQLNPVFLMQAVVDSEVPYRIWDAVREHIDLSEVKGQDEELGRQVFVMSLIALVMTMAEAMKYPEKIGACREELLTRLNVLKNGSLAIQPV